MKIFTVAVVMTIAAAANADTSCALSPVQSGEPTTLLIRESAPNDEAIILISGRTIVFDCPQNVVFNAYECYGHTMPPIRAPAQLNVTSGEIEKGTLVVVSVRNEFFGKNEHIGYHRRHASVSVFRVDACERY